MTSTFLQIQIVKDCLADYKEARFKMRFSRMRATVNRGMCGWIIHYAQQLPDNIQKAYEIEWNNLLNQYKELYPKDLFNNVGPYWWPTPYYEREMPYDYIIEHCLLPRIRFLESLLSELQLNFYVP